MAYAVIRTGGKQYRVAAGDTLEVEKLEGSVGERLTLSDVLLIKNGDDVQVGQPLVDGAHVTARISGQYRGDKILVFRYRPKKRIRVRKGHRQYITRLEIESIESNGQTLVQEEPVGTLAATSSDIEDKPVVIGDETPATNQADTDAPLDGSASQPEVIGTETPVSAEPNFGAGEGDSSVQSPNDMPITSEAEADPTTDPAAVDTLDSDAKDERGAA